MHPWIRSLSPGFTQHGARRAPLPQRDRKELAKLKKSQPDIYSERGWNRSIISMVWNTIKTISCSPQRHRSGRRKLFESLIGNRRNLRLLSLLCFPPHQTQRQTANKIIFHQKDFSFVEFVFPSCEDVERQQVESDCGAAAEADYLWSSADVKAASLSWKRRAIKVRTNFSSLMLGNFCNDNISLLSLPTQPRLVKVASKAQQVENWGVLSILGVHPSRALPSVAVAGENRF